LLFQEPPRRTALDPSGSRAGSSFGPSSSRKPFRAEPAVAKDRAAQPERVRLFGMGDPGHHSLPDILLLYGASAAAIAQPAQPVAEPIDILLRQPPQPAAAKTVAEEVRALRAAGDARLGWMQAQPPPRQEGLDLDAPSRQLGAIVMEQREVVNITDIPPTAQPLLDEMIQRVEIDVREELARQITDGQAAAPLQRAQEIIARIVQMHRLLRVGAVDNRVEQAQAPRAIDAPTQIRPQDRMIDRRKVAIDIRAEYEARLMGEALIGLYAGRS
jgi:hypothetical protein